MKILKYKKMSKGRYKITFDTSELIIYEDVIIKNNLLLEKNITLKLLEKILEENKYYEVYNLGLSYIETKLRTEKELKEYLMKKLFKEDIIDKVIYKLKIEGYINEQKYIEAYINDKVKLTSKGPFIIKKELIELGLDENIINEYLNKIDFEIWKEKLNKIINKRINQMNNKSLYMIKNKLKIDLYNLGYQKELIEELLAKINKNDEDSLEKEYIKIYNKYKKKYKEEFLNSKIKNSLYQKGFNLEDIERIINKNKDLK